MSKLIRPPVFREDGTIAIQLTQGREAIIDVEDAHLAERNWFTKRDSRADLFYAGRRHSGKIKRTVFLHRDVLNPLPSEEVDHIDGDGLNNRRSNLRIVDRNRNVRNMRLRANNTSGFVGVSFYKPYQKWLAKICQRHLGYFDTAEEANSARLKAEREAWGVEPRRRKAHGEDS